MAEAADTAPEAGPQDWLGFRGFAAGFQPGLAPFLDRHGARLGGLTVVDRPEVFIAHVAGSRPDYVLLAGSDTRARLLSDLGDAARSSALAVAAVGALPGAEALPPTIQYDRLEAEFPADALALRLRALIRRCRPQALTDCRSWGALTLDEACMTFSVRERTVSLRRELLCVLGTMMDAPDRVWERAALHELVFGQGSANDIRAIDTRISRARRHVQGVVGCDPVRTVRGVGYALVPDP